MPLPLPCHDCEEWQHRWRIVIVWVVNNSAGSRPWDKKGGRSSISLNKGGVHVSKKFFSTLRALVWSKNKAGARAPRASPLDPPLNKTQRWIMHPLSSRAVNSLAARSLASLNKLGGSARRVRWTIRNVMGVGVGEVQKKYSSKGEISWKIQRNVNKKRYVS